MRELYHIVAILGLLIWNELESGLVFAYILCVFIRQARKSESERRIVDDDDDFVVILID